MTGLVHQHNGHEEPDENDSAHSYDSDRMSGDEREVIAERLEALRDESNRLSLDEVAENLGIDTN